MPLAAKLTDKGTRHDGYYETAITAGSSTVLSMVSPQPVREIRRRRMINRSIPLIPEKSPEARQPSLLTACPPPEPVMLLIAAAWLLVAAR